MNVCRAILPHLRDWQAGTIINISSIGGKFVIPYYGVYNSTKFAVEGFSEGLWHEVKPFGIQCCTVLPGDTKTDFTKSRKFTQASENEKSAYYKRMKTGVKKMEHDEQHGMKPEAIARDIVKQIERKKMKPRVIPGFQYKAICVLNGLFPASWRLKLISIVYS